MTFIYFSMSCAAILDFNFGLYFFNHPIRLFQNVHSGIPKLDLQYNDLYKTLTLLNLYLWNDLSPIQYNSLKAYRLMQVNTVLVLVIHQWYVPYFLYMGSHLGFPFWDDWSIYFFQNMPNLYTSARSWTWWFTDMYLHFKVICDHADVLVVILFSQLE